MIYNIFLCFCFASECPEREKQRVLLNWKEHKDILIYVLSNHLQQRQLHFHFCVLLRCIYLFSFHYILLEHGTSQLCSK